jgi:hypothetical protein
MIFTTSGHIAIAEAMYSQQMYLAWGTLPAFLGGPITISATAGSGGSLTVGNYVYKVTTLNNGGESTPSSSTGATISSSGGTINITWSPVSGATGYNIYGRTVANNYQLIGTTTSTSFLDNGTAALVNINPPVSDGTSASPWTSSVPAPSVGLTGLYQEVGRRLVSLIQYVYPSSTGSYSTTAGRWAVSTVPTNYVYTYVGFDTTDADTNTIYQFGLFIGTAAITGYVNASYLLPGQISNPGTLLALDNVAPIIRNSSTSEIHQIVMTF